MRIHHRIETEVEFSDDQLRKMLKLHPKAFVTEVKREERDWPKKHTVVVVKLQRHVHSRRGV